MKTMKIAMIGVGCISGIYLDNITKVFKEIELIGVCDLVRERAENAQKNYGVPKIYETMHDAFADPEVDIVLNLTRPYEHFAVTKAALEAGKHVYSDLRYPENAYLFFGKETKGLPEWLLHENPAFCARLPMLDDARARSLNLSNTVAVAVYEVLRQWGFPALLCEGHLREYED